MESIEDIILTKGMSKEDIRMYRKRLQILSFQRSKEELEGCFQGIIGEREKMGDVRDLANQRIRKLIMAMKYNRDMISDMVESITDRVIWEENLHKVNDVFRIIEQRIYERLNKGENLEYNNKESNVLESYLQEVFTSIQRIKVGRSTNSQGENKESENILPAIYSAFTHILAYITPKLHNLDRKEEEENRKIPN